MNAYRDIEESEAESADGIDRMMRAEYKRERKQRNTAVIVASGVPHRTSNNGECLTFDKPHADFYPSTGRWRSKKRTLGGGPKNFLEWHAARQRRGETE